MRKFLLFALLLGGQSAVHCQIKPIDKIKPVKPLTTVAPATNITLYENPNYNGAFKTVGPGRYLLTDFNDVTSSVKVPAGMVAYIYENGNAEKGYGRAVDLLEDMADLSSINFNDVASYIDVFYSTRDNNFVWARNAMVNGQFVAGHWERKKANPGPVNNTPTVSPSIDPPLPTGPTVLSVNGPVTTITSLGVQSNEGKIRWEQAMNNQMGVIGNDYRGIDEIGTACIQRASNNRAIPDYLNFWYPQKQKNDHRSVVYFKRTLVGTLERAKQYIKSGTFEDYDANIDIKPDPNYMYLLTDAHAPEYTDLMRSQYYGSFTTSGESGCPDKFDALEAEINDRDNAPEGYKSKLVEMNENRLGQKIAVYGPWIYDKGHCCHPEIHPAEQLWWSEGNMGSRKFNLNVVCDLSNRYAWRFQMDDGTKLRPWAEPPIKGIYAIAFEYTLNGNNPVTSNFPTLQFEVQNIQDKNVIEYPNADQTYSLVYNGQKLVNFIPHNNAFKVSFEHVGISPENRNKLKGFLVIETSVGTTTQIATEAKDPLTGQTIKLPMGSSTDKVTGLVELYFFKKSGGLYYFTVTEKMVGNLPVMGSR